MLKDPTIAQVAGLKADLVIRDHDGGASYSFTHDIFFEWVFFRQLIELGDDWTHGLTEAGEPPLLGRVVGLLAQSALASPGKWSAGYRDLEGRPLRPQWRREWLTAPPFTPAFAQGHQEFQALLAENNYALLEKLLVWFQAQHTIPSPIIFRAPRTRWKAKTESAWRPCSAGLPTSRAGAGSWTGYFRLPRACLFDCCLTSLKSSAFGRTCSRTSRIRVRRPLSMCAPIG